MNHFRKRTMRHFQPVLIPRPSGVSRNRLTRQTLDDDYGGCIPQYHFQKRLKTCGYSEKIQKIVTVVSQMHTTAIPRVTNLSHHSIHLISILGNALHLILPFHAVILMAQRTILAFQNLPLGISISYLFGPIT